MGLQLSSSQNKAPPADQITWELTFMAQSTYDYRPGIPSKDGRHFLTLIVVDRRPQEVGEQLRRLAQLKEIFRGVNRVE